MYWSLPKQITFRFFFIYTSIYILSNQFITSYPIELIWQKIVPWFASVILRLENPISTFGNGSGDTTYNYVSLVVYALVALLGTLIWSIIDHKRLNYSELYKLFLVLLRYYLAYQMALYGLAKVFYLQFVPPNHAMLIRSYGDSSPMGLLWTFMGYSRGYNYFTGFAELLGGLLLLPRKTVTLGALVVFGVMSNVMMLNYFYDVPVKLLSTHLVLISLFLLLLDTQRLLKFFILNQSTEAVIIQPFFQNPKFEKIKNWVKWGVVVVGLIGMSAFVLSIKIQYSPEKMKSPIAGIYEVEKLKRNGEEIPPLLTDTTYWRSIVVDRKGSAWIHTIDNKRHFYDFKVNPEKKSIVYNPNNEKSAKSTLYYSKLDSTHMKIEGIHRTDTLELWMKIKTKEDFRLTSRGFHWINEFPFNR